MSDLDAIMTIAYRDFLKFMRDPGRIISSFIFPALIVGALGGSLKASLGTSIGFDFLAFVYTGVLAQTLFQSSAMGIISLIEDRENDYSQEIFVSPISRYSIVFGKIAGESLVALPQGLAIFIFGFVIGIRPGWQQALALLPVAIVACLFGGAFGLVVLGNFGGQRFANQVFAFLMWPQYFLAGVFNPITRLPLYLEIPSRLTPMRYIVDLTRAAFYRGQSDYSHVVLDDPLLDLTVIGVLFVAFMIAGTALFVRAERNR